MNSCWELFAFDLDGTLLDDTHSLPQEVAAWVSELARKTRVTVATGRSLASAQPHVEKLKINTPAILYHGAVVYDFSSGKSLFTKKIPPPLAHQALDLLASWPVSVEAYLGPQDPEVYVWKVDPRVERFSRKERLTLAEAELRELAEEGIAKLLVLAPPERLFALAATLSQQLPQVRVVRSEVDYLELLPPGVDKGEALAWLCRRLKVPLEKVVAVGDQESDLPMIRRAGLGVAMGHAPPQVRQAADLVVEQVVELVTRVPIGD
ncbi:MAG TPA: HAD family phosphatase [Candidatus Acetothermia bacterium]|nr:HAD family phosphatase [Candidatus Acetothermia bacterium]